MRRQALATLGLVLALAGSLCAHPVPRNTHDRVLVVRFSRDTVVVDYRLEVDEFTVVYTDLPAISDKVSIEILKKPKQAYQAFVDHYGEILARGLFLTLDGQELYFRCTARSFQVLDHLRCDFRFEARWRLEPERKHAVAFREGNYEYQVGMIRLGLAHDASVALENRVEPDEALKARPAIELKPGDEEKLRRAKAHVRLTGSAPSGETAAPAAAMAGKNSLARLLDEGYGLGMLLVLAIGFGAAHALTPGHGKTLVAAYLVGERGTVLHAVVLGLVTTVTHTGVVILIAFGLQVFFPQAVPAHVQTALGMAGGLLIAGMGAWLLLRRLSGGVDHVHLGSTGYHHHHHHGNADHYHDAQGHVHAVPAVAGKVGWWGIMLLGMSGGIVPCWDAIALLCFTILTNQVWLGVPLLLAFSAGLAGVLVLIGVLVVYLRGFANSRLGEGRVVKSLPLVSAALVLLLGLWLCWESVPHL